MRDNEAIVDAPSEEASAMELVTAAGRRAL